MNSTNFPKIVNDALVEAMSRVKSEKNRLELDYVSERTIVGRIAHYLSLIIEPQFNELSVDVEYSVGFDSANKCLDANSEFARLGKKLGRKIREEFGSPQIRIVPDIVIHVRGPNGPNVAAIEVKVDSAQDSDEARYAKLKLKLLKEFPYEYQVGVFINLPRAWDDFVKESNWLFIE